MEENEVQETTEVQDGLDQDVESTQDAQDTASEDQSTIQGKEAPQEESFISPNDLPDELKPHWKRMHRAYTKRLEEIKSVRDKAAMVDQFQTDRNYALREIAAWAAQNGYNLSPVGQPNQQVQGQQGNRLQPPQQLVDAVRAQLPPELQWMAESQAASQWAAMQMMFQPVMQQQQQQQRQQVLAEYDRAANELSQTVPGWESHESEMDKLLQFMQSPSVYHPEFGSKIALLYNMVNGNAAAIRETTNRFNKAVKNRVGSSASGGRAVSNLADRIKKAPNNNDAWAMAANAASGNQSD